MECGFEIELGACERSEDLPLINSPARLMDSAFFRSSHWQLKRAQFAGFERGAAPPPYRMTKAARNIQPSGFFLVQIWPRPVMPCVMIANKMPGVETHASAVHKFPIDTGLRIGTRVQPILWSLTAAVRDRLLESAWAVIRSGRFAMVGAPQRLQQRTNEYPAPANRDGSWDRVADGFSGLDLKAFHR